MDSIFVVMFFWAYVAGMAGIRALSSWLACIRAPSSWFPVTLSQSDGQCLQDIDARTLRQVFP
jgi:hypothetical protein